MGAVRLSLQGGKDDAPSNLLLTLIPTSWYVTGKRIIMVEAKALPDTRTKLLDAALLVIRTKGYAGTSVDDLCQEAGVTKGAFFHHFKSKEDMAVAAAAHFGAMAEGLFSQAGLPHACRSAGAAAGLCGFPQGAFFRARCRSSPACSAPWCRRLTKRTRQSRRRRTVTSANMRQRLRPTFPLSWRRAAVPATWTAASLALYTQAVIQGAFILAKAKGGPQVAVDCLNHLSCHLKLLFNHKP